MEANRIRELLKRISKNDEKALEELFHGTKNQLYLVAKEYCTERSYIEDVLSIGYLKIYQKSKTYNEAYNGYNWMHEIIKNTAIDYSRSHKRIRNIEEYNDAKYIQPNPNSEHIKERIIKEELTKALKKEYQVVYLRIWEKKTLAAIAELNKTNITFVYRLYQEALNKLRKELE